LLATANFDYKAYKKILYADFIQNYLSA
jgi:hypothetical protein